MGPNHLANKGRFESSALRRTPHWSFCCQAFSVGKKIKRETCACSGKHISKNRFLHTRMLEHVCVPLRGEICAARAEIGCAVGRALQVSGERPARRRSLRCLKFFCEGFQAGYVAVAHVDVMHGTCIVDTKKKAPT